MKLLATIAGLLLTGCVAGGTELTPQEAALASSADVDTAIAQRLRPFATSMERLMAATPDYGETPGPGIVLSIEPKQGRSILKRIRTELAGTGYGAYLSDDGFGERSDKIAILKGDDLAYLAVVRTDGINYDLDHAKVLERYTQWAEKYGLRLVGAGSDWIEAEFTRPPSDWKVFAAEVYEFCPDVVDQGTGSVPALAEEMKAQNAVYLWWD